MLLFRQLQSSIASLSVQNNPRLDKQYLFWWPNNSSPLKGLEQHLKTKNLPSLLIGKILWFKFKFCLWESSKSPEFLTCSFLVMVEHITKLFVCSSFPFVHSSFFHAWCWLPNLPTFLLSGHVTWALGCTTLQPQCTWGFKDTLN